MVAVSMPAEPRLHVVVDPEDSVELARHVAGLADRAEGRAVLHPTPGIASSTDLAADLLVSLGKRFDALRFERARSRAWPLVEIWFQAEEVRHLFVLRAARLNHPMRQRISDLGRRCGIEVWFIGSIPTGRCGSVRHWDGGPFRERWADAVISGDEVDEAGFPEVPDDSFATFRATCRGTLDASSFEQVDRVYRESVDVTHEWLKQRAVIGSGRSWLDKSEAASQLQSLMVSSSSASEALTRLRGAQGAYFLAGWLVPFPPTGCHSIDGIVPLGPTLDPVTARRLRRLCSPRSSAAMALMLATDLRSEGLSRLNMSDIDQDGGGVTVEYDRHRFSVPGYARSLVRALLVERTRAGAGDADAIFIRPATGERFTPERLQGVLRALNKATALATGVDFITRPTQTPRGWLWERRLGLEFLDSEEALAR
jgi:hypothetical protein